jgi:hypothetical protein
MTKNAKKLTNGSKIERSGWAQKGELSVGGGEIRDVLLSGAVVVAAARDMAKNPIFVHHEQVFKLDWIEISRKCSSTKQRLHTN